jgi:hypothetical protein
LVSSFVLLAAVGVAHATHKAWMLRQPGISCQVLNPGNVTTDLRRSEAGLYNGYFGGTHFNPVTVQCPIAISGMFGGTRNGTSFGRPSWLAAREARVFVDAPNPITCTANALSNTGSELISRTVTVTNTPGGFYPSILIKQNGSGQTWGGTLGNGNPSGMSLAGLNYTCTLPVGAAIFGFDTRICQNQVNCFGG